MKPEYKLYMTNLFSLEQNDEGSCSTAVGFIQVWLSVGWETGCHADRSWPHGWSVLSLLGLCPIH
jgi:hypothetical protein